MQDFDLDAVNSINQTPGHYEMSASQYANPANKGAFVNKLDFVVLAALEIDTGFNVNVLTGSDGVLRGAPGGHPDTAAGSKVCIIVTPLTRGRMATVCEKVVTVTTPGDCVDVLVTDYGIAVNPLRPDLMECLDNAGIPHVTIESLKEKAYSLVGRPDDLEWEDKVVAVLEARDGTVVLTSITLVFAMLVALCLIITLEGKIFDALNNKKNNKPAAPKAPAAKAAPAAKPAAPVAKADNGAIPGEIIAAISAAVAEVMGSNAVIRGIKRITKPAAGSRRGAWGEAGVREHTTPFM